MVIDFISKKAENLEKQVQQEEQIPSASVKTHIQFTLILSLVDQLNSMINYLITIKNNLIKSLESMKNKIKNIMSEAYDSSKKI